MKKRKLDSLAVEMLLDGDDASLARMCENLKRQLDVVMGRKCPYCGGSNVAVGDDQGICDDCDEYYDLPLEQTYGRDGNPVEE